MTDTLDRVRQHYDPDLNDRGLADRVIAILDQLDQGPMGVAALAGLDQFHVRGLDATIQLAKLAGIHHRMTILDAGSGLGGPSRYLAETHGCRVTGVDLSPAYVEAARLLAVWTGLEDLAAYEVGDLCDLRFADGSFDVVWTQHVVMNIADRAALYGELRRVLRPAGRLAFYDVIAADARAPIQFPVPWAQSEETSFLLNRAATEEMLAAAGFAHGAWTDVTDEAIAWFGAARPPTPGGLSLATVMGPRFGEMAMNLAGNLMSGRLRLAMGVYETPAV